ncbi:MAG TPA: glycoside hydrolase family 130 protein [Candidatus Acidoferrales bacterium]
MKTWLQVTNRSIGRLILPLVFLAALGAFAANVPAPFGEWTRASQTPILSPQGDGFESAGTFNPAVIRKDGVIVMLYRAQDRKGTSSLGYATSSDGIHFERRATPVMTAQEPYEKGGGVEDPRLIQFGDTYYLTYTGYNNVDGTGPRHLDAQLCLATSKDLIHWDRHGVILPAYQGRWNTNWTKSGAIVPEKIHGKYWMYYLADARGPKPQTGIATSEDLLHWTDASDQPVQPARPGKFDSLVVEPGPAPVITDQGILLTYNGADDHQVYKTGWALFDKSDPSKLIARADAPMFEPTLEWEKVGQVPNVVFVEGLVPDGKRWLYYYGGADKYIGVASVAAPH